MDALQDFKPDVFVSLGDFMDCAAVSRWSKDPSLVTGFKAELDYAERLLDEIEERTPGARRIWIDGNHEDRVERYIRDRAPELHGLINIQSQLHLERRGWEYVPYKQSTRIGKLWLTHDVGTAGRYAAFKALDTFQSPIVTGHTHRLGYVVEGDATGDSHVSHMLGWLGDVEKIDYVHQQKAKKEWALGFGYGYITRPEGLAHLVPVPIVDGTCVVEGRVYDGRVRRARKRAA